MYIDAAYIYFIEATFPGLVFSGELASFSGPAQLFVACMQYGIAGRAWSREHYVIDKRPKFSE